MERVKANELRLGNWIMDRGGKAWQIYTFDGRYKVEAEPPSLGHQPGFGEMFGHPLTEEIDYLKPIPLSPEILQKCGFKYQACGISGADMWQGMAFWFRDDLCLRGSVSTVKGGTLKLSGYFNSNIQYIHQLQNLYYCLTGTELEIKL